MTWSLFLSAPYALFTYQWLSEATQAFSEELSSIFSYFPIAWMVLNTENMLIFCASCSGIHNVRRTMIKKQNKKKIKKTSKEKEINWD